MYIGAKVYILIGLHTTILSKRDFHTEYQNYRENIGLFVQKIWI